MTTMESGAMPSGRLELTWTNKHLRLLSTGTGGYEWTTPGDYRIAEVRLLHEVREVGKSQRDGNARRTICSSGGTPSTPSQL